MARVARDPGRLTHYQETSDCPGATEPPPASQSWPAAHPDYVAGLLPGLVLGGSGVGLTQAPLFITITCVSATAALVIGSRPGTRPSE